MCWPVLQVFLSGFKRDLLFINRINYMFSREIPGFIQWIKVISSKVVIFTLWKYQKCYFHGVKITSDCDVTSGTKIWEKHVAKTQRENVINRKFNALTLNMEFILLVRPDFVIISRVLCTNIKNPVLLPYSTSNHCISSKYTLKTLQNVLNVMISIVQ